MIAKDVIEALDDKKLIGEIEAVNPGFINIKLDAQAVADYLNQMKEDENLGLNKAEEAKTIVVDYGGPRRSSRC